MLTRTTTIGFAGLMLIHATCLAQVSRTPLEKCRKTNFTLNGDNFDKGWKDRVALEFEVVNKADLKALRTGLADKNMYVRSISARVLGIRGDKTSADALAKLALTDPEHLVRIRAVEALGLLKAKPKVIARATKDKNLGVQWEANLSAELLKQKRDYAADVQRAFAEGITRNEMGQAVVGKPAPDFTAWAIDGKPFRLSKVLGKKPIAIYFAAFDG